MPAHPLTAPRYHTQDADYYCGSAVAMSFAEFVGAHYEEQDVLNGVGRGATIQAGAYLQHGVDPAGMLALLNDRLASAGRAERCEVMRHTSAADAARYLVRSLRSTGLPGALLGLHGAHWMLCVDTADAEWAPGQVGYLRVHDPVPHAPGGSKPIHGSTDACGSTLALGFAQEWERRPWKKILSPVGGVYPTVAVAPAAGEPVPVLAGDTPLVEDALPPILASVLAEVGGALGVSLGVHTATLDDIGYEIRPLVSGDGVHGLARYDAQIFQGFVRVSGATALPDDTILAQGALSFAGLPAATPLQFAPQFTWQMCEESQSPYLPFRRVRIPGLDISFYVRIDGRFFWQPTPLRVNG